MTIIKAAKKDTEKLVDFYDKIAVWLDAEGACSYEYWKMFYTHEAINKHLKENEIYFIKEGSKIVATVGMYKNTPTWAAEAAEFYEDRDDMVYLFGLAVAPGCHKKGHCISIFIHVCSKLIEIKKAGGRWMALTKFSNLTDMYNKYANAVGTKFRKGAEFTFYEQKLPR